MRKLLRLFSNVELMVLVFFANVLFSSTVLLNMGCEHHNELNHYCKECNLADNIYYLSARFDYLVMSIIGYNIVSRKYHIIVLPACALAAMRLINEILNIFNVVQINNVPLLTLEFFIIVFIVWRTSKVTYI